MNKQAIRSEMRERRAKLPMDKQEASAQAAAKIILNLPEYKRAKTVMAYAAVRGELSLEPVIREVLASGRRLALPRCEKDGQMTARLVESPAQLEPGTYGLMEPGEGCAVLLPQEIDLILVPGTAFGRDGSRVGQGAGYYDRFLPQTRAFFAGVCHEFALFDCLPRQKHDISMHAVITPDGLIRTGEKQEEPS